MEVIYSSIRFDQGKYEEKTPPPKTGTRNATGTNDQIEGNVPLFLVLTLLER
jgi:hypothetical protein